MQKALFKRQEAHPWLSNPRFAECRLLTGHRWYRAGLYNLDGSHIGMTHRCRECKLERELWFDMWTGKTDQRRYSYTYAIGYKSKGKGAPGPFKKAELRSTYMRILLSKNRKSFKKIAHNSNRA